MKNGFSILEVMFVLTVLGILAAVAIPKLLGEEAKKLVVLKDKNKDINKSISPTDTEYPNIIYISPKK